LGNPGNFNGAAGIQGQAGGFGRGALPATLGTTLGLNIPFYQNEFTIMSQQLTLSDDAKPKLQEKVNTMNAELQTFLQNSMANLGGGVRGNRAGRGRGGAGATPQPAADTSGQLTPEQIKIRDDFQLLADQHQLKIDSDLTDDQKLSWESYKLNLWLKPHLNGLQLSDDQKDKVRSYVTDTAKAIIALTDGKDMETLEGRLFRKIIADILTEPQAAVVMQQLPATTPPAPLGGGVAGAAGGVGGGGGFGAAGNFGRGQAGAGGNFGAAQGNGAGVRGGRFGGGGNNAGGGFGGGGNNAGGGFGGGGNNAANPRGGRAGGLPTAANTPGIPAQPRGNTGLP
jgi:hypothetical protein